MKIESRDGLTNELESSGSIDDFRAANAEDAECLEALDRLERGESKSELVGFFRLTVAERTIRLADMPPGSLAGSATATLRERGEYFAMIDGVRTEVTL